MALIVVAAVLAALLLLAQLKCRAEATYDENGFRWRVSVGAFCLAPREKKGEKKKPKGNAKAPKKPREAPSGAQLRALFDLALRLLKRFFKRLRIERLRVYFVSAFDDPYDTAIAYGYAGSAMETVTAFANGRIRHLELHTQPDFDATQPQLDFHALVFVRLGNLIALALAALSGYRAAMRSGKTEKENEHGKSVDR